MSTCMNFGLVVEPENNNIFCIVLTLKDEAANQTDNEIEIAALFISLSSLWVVLPLLPLQHCNILR